MVIYEHVKGTIVIPIYDDNGEFSNRTADIDFTEDDIIKDSCTITARACDDNTFSLGGVRSAELSIKLRLDGEGVNAYNLYGAKITLYSCYKQNPTASDWVFRGFYWVTSATHVKNIYTLRASDVLVWLDANNYSSDSNTTSKNTEGKTEIDSVLINTHYSLNNSANHILEVINKELEQLGIDTIKFWLIPETQNTTPHNLVGIFRNDSPEFPAGEAMREWGVLDENDGYFNSRSASDYIADIAELYAGFATERTCLNTTPPSPELQIIPFGYQNQSAGYGTVSIKYSEIERDSLDIAGYQLYFQQVYFNAFDNTWWKWYSTAKKYGANVIVDITGNSFLDGRNHGMIRYDKDHNTNHCSNDAENNFEIMSTIKSHLSTLTIRPFKLKCHKMFENWKEYPKLGMQIEIEDADGKTKKSIITKTIWKFRGGWELGCTGSDSRILSQAAKKSLASHASGSVKMYANYVASRLNGNVKTAQTAADNAATAAKDANDSASSAHTSISDTDSREARNMQRIQDAFALLGVDFNYEYVE